jgi:hypothetical protein
MIQYIALVLAADAGCKASRAGAAASKAYKASREAGGDQFIVVKPCPLEERLGKKPTTLLGKFFNTGWIKVLLKEPYGTFGRRRSDIKNLAQQVDGAGQPYVAMEVSESADVWHDGTLMSYLRFPGKVEDYACILNGKKR